MDDALNQRLRTLLYSREVAALGTVYKGEPFVSMVPYALHHVLDGTGPDFLIHVSALSAHTRHKSEDPRVSLMVTAAEGSRDEDGTIIQAQALPRVTVKGDAVRLDPAGTGHAPGLTTYLDRFPNAAQMFELPDFSLFAIRPESIRFIAGFGKAHSMTAQSWATVLS